MNKHLLDELMQLSLDERLDIAVRLWESVHPPGSALPGEEVPLTDEPMDEINRRLAEHERNPDRARPWREVMERLCARFEK